jgi:outer membrane protein OmpA-like peptidoglycan-associated protein
MRKTAFFVSAAIGGLIAISPLAQAGPLGGLAVGLGGGFGGGPGGLSGGLNGSLNGAPRPEPDQTIDPVTGRITAAPERARMAAPTPLRNAPSTAPRTLVRAAPSLRPVGEVAVIRARQSEALIAGGVTVLSAPDAYVYMDRQADDLRRDLVGTGVDVVRQGDAIVLQLPSDVNFAFDKSDIRERFFPVLSAVANTLNAYPATFVDVIGHTDAIGSDAYNQALSERRAAAVADFVQRRERIPARLYVAGRGKSEPIASNATVQGRAENRRVEILLHPYTDG